MGRSLQRAMLLTVMFTSSLASAQQACEGGLRIDGTVSDPTGAMIPGATIQAPSGEVATTDAAGRYVLPCVRAAAIVLTATAQGFAAATFTIQRQAGEPARFNFKLAVEDVQTQVQVNGDQPGVDSDGGAGTVTLKGKALEQLADDPDDFLRQLQALSASAGGSPASAVIVVDGFQNGSALPPKSSIASVRVNPDLFSAEYGFPPFDGGLIEITTKPGADLFHGALFFADSNSSFNATDPFSATAAAAGKRRYGFELSGPLVPKKSGFALALEKRDIDEFNVVNAVALDAAGNSIPLRQTVAAPERLWIASARGDWQVTSRDVAALSFSSNVNNQGNQGIGGLTLAEAGYSNLASENALRFTNTLIQSANLLHETHIGYMWKRTQQWPLSSAPSLQVSGYFTGGGATSQNLNNRERDLEADDDLLITRGKHEWKIGVQSLGLFAHDYDPDTFNGAYVFGGGVAPVLDGNNHPTGETTTISPLEQYHRAQNNLAGGTPTTYQLTSGTPVVPVTQWRVALYAQDTIKLAPRFTVNLGLRYALQTAPDSFANVGPRVALSWSPDKKQTWVFRARAGLFSGPTNLSYAIEANRLNGVRQQKVTVYSPDYVDPLTQIRNYCGRVEIARCGFPWEKTTKRPIASLNTNYEAALTQFAGSIKVSNLQQFPPSFAQHSTFAGYFNAEHEIAHHWNLGVNLFLGDDWNVVRTRNINAPLVPSSIGLAPDPITALGAPRPIAPNENILQYQNAGHSAGHVLSFVVDQHSYKQFGLFAYYARRIFRSDGGNGDVIPQSSYSDAGESARADWANVNGFFLTGNLNLPYRVVFTTQFNVLSGLPYNITTGTDNNGDGNFNDRPSYASASGAGVYDTRFGLLTANTVNGDVPRNRGTMPTLLHMDASLSRVFHLSSTDKDSSRSITLNIRSANLLNHTNVTAVGTVLSPNLGQPISADTARRVEIGARFAF
jgi:Carboxypeptidase regulatory-like domain/TonB dependent receptor